jgi:hypothetical protein
MSAVSLPPPTAIKPSLAIIRGCKIAPRKIEGEPFDFSAPFGACAIGAMYLGYGLDPDVVLAKAFDLGVDYSDVTSAWASEHRQQTVEVWQAYDRAYGVRMSADNDENGLTREQIALRLAKIGL